MSDDIKINQKQIDWYIRASGGKLDPHNSVLQKPCKECGKGHPEKSMWMFNHWPEGYAYSEWGYFCHGCAKYRITEAYDCFEYPEELQWENYKPWKDLSNTEELVRISEVCNLFINQEKEKQEMDNGVTELDKLCHAHQQAYEEEKKAKAKRLEIEALIITISDVQEEGSSVTQTRYYKCTCTGKLTRKLDVVAWENIRDDIPEDLRPVKTKVEIDLPKLRAIENANPELFKLVCNAIATKPAKTSIKVEVLN